MDCVEVNQNDILPATNHINRICLVSRQFQIIIGTSKKVRGVMLCVRARNKYSELMWMS